jgi:hypothetical protein
MQTKFVRDNLVTYFMVEHLAYGYYIFQCNWMNWRSCSRTCIEIYRDCHRPRASLYSFLFTAA